MWDLIWNNIEIISGFILSVGLVALYAAKLRKLLKEAAELFLTFDKAMVDGKLDKQEIIKIKSEALDVWNAIKNFAKKK